MGEYQALSEEKMLSKRQVLFIGGFHVTQVSLIITQVKTKIRRLPFNKLSQETEISYKSNK